MSNNSSIEHKNSMKVTIFRSVSFIQNAQGASKDGNEAVADFLSQAAQGIGPYYKSFSAKVIGSGLTPPEQDLLLPHLLNIDASDKDFKKEVFKFFNEISTKVPFSSGRTLEIGLLESNSKPISKTNMPIDIEEYVRYRHAKEHPWVALDGEGAKSDQRKKFYIHDAEAAFKVETETMALHDEATGIWLQIKNTESKVNMLLTLMGLDERNYIGRNEKERKQNALKEAIDKKVAEFLKVYKDDKFETRYWLKAMLLADVVRLIGTSYVIRESNKLIGRSENEALLYLEDEANIDTITFLKGATQDALRKPKVRKAGAK